MTALRCWRAGAYRPAIRLQWSGTASWPLCEAGYDRVVVHWTVRD